MDFDLPYPEAGESLELWVREEYEKSLAKLGQLGDSDLEKSLGVIDNLYSVLKESVPLNTARGRVMWASDMLRVYRNVGAVYASLMSNELSLPPEYQCILDEHEITGPDELRRGLDYSKGFKIRYKEFLEKYGVGDLDDVSDRLDELKSLKTVLEDNGVGETSLAVDVALKERASLLEKQSDIEKTLLDF